MAELSQEDMDRILLEEKFRATTKAGLESQSPKKPMTSWEFLNSPFALLLISSVVISAGGALFTSWKTSYEKKQEKLRQVTPIQTEIAYRASKLLMFVSVASENPDVPVSVGKMGEGHSAGELRQAVKRFIDGRKPEVQSLYPEFENLSALQLAIRLQGLNEGKKESGLSQLIADMSGIDLLKADTYNNPLLLGQVIQKELSHYPDLRDSNFYFTDCQDPSVPFC